MLRAWRPAASHAIIASARSARRSFAIPMASEWREQRRRRRPPPLENDGAGRDVLRLAYPARTPGAARQLVAATHRAGSQGVAASIIRESDLRHAAPSRERSSPRAKTAFM